MKTIAEYDQEIQQNPNDPKLYNSRGDVYAKKAVDDKAIADFNKAIQLDPNYMTAYYNRGIAFFNTGDNERAIADFNKAIQLNPNFADVYYTRGYLYLHGKKDFEKALADFDKAVQINPNNTAAYRRLAEIYKVKNDYEKSIANYDQAIRITPNDAEAYLYRGRVYSDRGYKQNNKEDFARAIADYDQVIRIKPDFALAYRDRGMAHGLFPGSDVARLKQSIADCEKALQLGLDDENRIVTDGFLKSIRGKLGALQGLNEGRPGLIMSKEDVAPVQHFSSADNKPNKKWLTTLLLAIFLGFLGVHRFYVGRIGTGIILLILYLLSILSRFISLPVIMGFGPNIIWLVSIVVIVDIIMIVIGKFKDKDGLQVRRQ